MRKTIPAFVALLFICLSSLAAFAQYCIPVTNTPCTVMRIVQVKLGTIDNSSGCSGGYSDYTSLSTTLAPGLTYTISIRTSAGYPQRASVFVDWNNDNDFTDANEMVASNVNIPDNGIFGTASITVPANATGSHRLRVASDYVDFYTVNNSCGPLKYGEAEDYTIDICSGIDNDSDGYTVCQGDCDDNNSAVHPNATEIMGNNIDDNCDGVVDAVKYCTPTGVSPCTNMWIKRVKFGTIDNNTACSPGGYGDYSFLSTVLATGTSHTISITSANGYEQLASVFIDWNKDGDFNDANEQVISNLILPTAANTPAVTSFTVPANAVGSYRLRVVSDYKDFYTPNNACYSGKYGEAEDYTFSTPCEAPSITCPDPITVKCASEVPAPNPSSVTAASICDAAVVTWVNDVISNQTCASRYIITRTYKATNSAGSATCTQIITVNDQTGPDITSIPADKTVSCTSEIPAADYSAVIANDNCGGGVTISHNDVVTPGTCVNKYSIARTYTATDVCGNTSSKTQTIFVNDETAPQITSIPQNVTVSCAADVPAADHNAVTATENCGGTVTISHSDVITPGPCANRYSIARTYKATDACGNSSSQTQTITVFDETAPVITCPGNITVAPTTLAGTVVNFSAPTFSDNCSGPVTVTQPFGKASGSLFPIGTTTNTFVAKDGCDNTKSCSFTVTVINPYCDNNPNSQKVYVCHNGKTNCISVNALQAHMAHGDYLGACSATSVTTMVSKPVRVIMEEKTGFDVKVYPNPSATNFRISVQGSRNERMTVRVKDAAGKAVLNVAGVQANLPIVIGNTLKTGIYFVEVVQGTNRQVVKLVKIN